MGIMGRIQNRDQLRHWDGMAGHGDDSNIGSTSALGRDGTGTTDSMKFYLKG